MTLSEDLLYVTSHKCVDINYNILTGAWLYRGPPWPCVTVFSFGRHIWDTSPSQAHSPEDAEGSPQCWWWHSQWWCCPFESAGSSESLTIAGLGQSLSLSCLGEPVMLSWLNSEEAHYVKSLTMAPCLGPGRPCRTELCPEPSHLSFPGNWT